MPPLPTNHFPGLQNAWPSCRVFSSSVAVPAKRSLYTSLVRSQLLYCSKIWHPYLLVDVKAIELVKRRATKFIVNDTSMDYRNRVIHLKLLPHLHFGVTIYRRCQVLNDTFLLCNVVHFSKVIFQGSLHGAPSGLCL